MPTSSGVHLSSSLHKTFLQDLELDGNPLEETAVKVFAGCLRSPGCQLRSISVSSCHLSSKSFFTIAGALAEGSPAIQMLNVYSNPRADAVSRSALIRAAEASELLLLVHREPADDGKLLKTLTTPGLDQTVGRGFLA